MDDKNNGRVFVAGGSGLVGTSLIKSLKAYKNVVQIGRKIPLNSNPSWEHVVTGDLGSVDLQHQASNTSSNSPSLGFICLGTTKKQAGSNAGLWYVDHDLVVHLAQQMHLAGVKHIGIVSSYGANASSVSHYLRCKGTMEQAVSEIGFDSIVFARPGPLVGEREQPRSDEKAVQAVLKVLNPLMLGPLSKLKPVKSKDVAKALFNKVKSLSRKPHKHAGTTIKYLHYRDIVTGS
ncbi:NAD-dependent epimerase/dehydratase family protein [Vibrio maerlii]|uniref:NAD-dependent epimerase/dehydratase family protein n=1 Tax=Vibrio maerlii TaxID=2231648 RepID=UPI000E3D02C1|nr:NAD-dependent epimerase/dehydratase family protein [Vibrio maerlii]